MYCAIVVILLLGVLVLFFLESNECTLAVRRTIAAQTQARRFRHCGFTPRSPEERYGGRLYRRVR